MIQPSKAVTNSDWRISYMW